jgi:co-chaperonin GroES (HSP10)
MPEVRLTGNNVLLMPVQPELKTPGGILRSPKYVDDTMQYRVLAVGPGRVVRKKGKPDVLIPIELERGDFALTGKYLGPKLQMRNGTIVIDADQIVAKWK